MRHGSICTYAWKFFSYLHANRIEKKLIVRGNFHASFLFQLGGENISILKLTTWAKTYEIRSSS